MLPPRASRPLLLVALLTLLGCPQPPPIPPEEGGDTETGLDAGTDAGTSVSTDAGRDAGTDAGTQDGTDAGMDAGPEWDGTATPLPEQGNWPEDPGTFAPCGIVTSNGGKCDASSFDLSGCDTASLENAATDGLHILTARSGSASSFAIGAQMLTLRDDGGTPLLNGQPATEQRVGNARIFSVQNGVSGNVRRTAVAMCQAPQAPVFTGCVANCRNGRLSGRATFRSERMAWRAGESEASGLELVSESFVDIGTPADVYVTQGHAYVVSLSRGPLLGGLTVFDVRDPAVPRKVKTIQFEGDNYWNAVWAKGNALYVASANNGVLIFDISTPANPQFITRLPSGGANNHTLFVEGNRLYATVDTGVSIFDVTTPTQPVEVGRYSSEGGFSYPHDMLAIGDRLYVSYADLGYSVVDVRDPANPVTLGTFTYDYNQYSHASAVGTFAGRTLSFMGGEGPGEHLRVLDVTDPANIVKIGRFQLRPIISIHNMLLVGKKLYIAWYQEGVRVLDVSNPTQPTQVAYYNTFRETDPERGYYYEGAIGIRLPGDGFIYTVDTSRGLLMLRER